MGVGVQEDDMSCWMLRAEKEGASAASSTKARAGSTELPCDKFGPHGKYQLEMLHAALFGLDLIGSEVSPWPDGRP